MATSVPEPEIVELDETPTAVIAAVVPMAEMVSFFDSAYGKVAGALGEQSIAPTGPAFARYNSPPEEAFDLEVGFPVDRSPSPSGEVRPGTLPGGRVARLVHLGAFEGLPDSWARLESWLREGGHQPGQVFWEVYVTEPKPGMDPADLRTELFWTLA